MLKRTKQWCNNNNSATKITTIAAIITPTPIYNIYNIYICMYINISIDHKTVTSLATVRGKKESYRYEVADFPKFSWRALKWLIQTTLLMKITHFVLIIIF